MNFLKEIKKNKEEFIKEIRELVKIPSVLEETPFLVDTPFGKPISESLNYVLNLGQKMGFETKNIKNVSGHIEYGEGLEIIGVLCHVDVVPADGKWKYPPFSATIEGDKIYGRGTLDDKGPTICSLFALKMIKDLNIKLNKKVRLILGTDEETAWRGIEKYLQEEQMPTVGFSPDADFPLIYGEKGILTFDLVANNNDTNLKKFIAGKRYNVVPEYACALFDGDLTKPYQDYLNKNNKKGSIVAEKIEMFGKSAHAMMPEAGENAAIELCKFLNKYTSNPLIKFVSDKLQDSRCKGMGLAYTNLEMGDLTMNVGILEIDQDKSRLGLNFRYPIGFDSKNFVLEFAKQANQYGLQLDFKEDKKPHFVDKNSKFVQALHKAYIEYTGDDKTSLKTIGGGTYARAIKNAVAFGVMFPGEIELAHQVDEYISIENAMLATAIIAQAIVNLGQMDET